MPTSLFLQFIFLALFNGYFSSDPDSTIVQSPENNDEVNGRIQMEKIREKTFISVDIPRARRRFPDSVMIQTLLNNTEKIGEMLMKNNEQKELTKFNRPFVQTIEPDTASIRNPINNARKMDYMRMEDDGQKVFISLDQPDSLVVKHMVPVVVNSENLWREVSTKRVDSTQDFSGRSGKLEMEEDEEDAFTDDYDIPVETDHPDSVIIQGPEDYAGKTGKIQMQDGEQIRCISVDESNNLVVTYMRPVVINSEVLWRIVRRETVNKPEDFTAIPDIRRSFGPLDPIFTTERSTVHRRITPGYNGRQTPPNRVKGNGNSNRENSRTTNPPPITDGEFFEDDKPKTVVTKAPGRISPDSNLIVGIVNDFAFKLVETLELESNFVISPLSIFTSLSMCYLGSDGRTKTQMQQVLGIDDIAILGERFHQGIKDLLSSVMGETPGSRLLVANGMFLAKNFAAVPEFQDNIRKYYNAEIQNLDFGNPSSSMQVINNWVTENTRSTITSIINSPPAVETRLMLLNAVYFKGMWKMQFPLQSTQNGKFQTLEGIDKQVPMMRMFDETFPAFKSDEQLHTFLKLPYEGDELSMIIALPYTARAKPMPSIRDRILRQVRAAMKDTDLGRLEIPKFHLEYTKSLIRPLQELGLTDIFDRNFINLSKLRKDNDIIVSAIMHKAVVDVNEAGTTASAITAQDFTPLIGKQDNFVANHPFAFYIVHEPTGLVLFYGKVFDFESEEGASVDRRPDINARPRIYSERRRVPQRRTRFYS